MSSGKSGASQQSLNHYGTIAVALGWGPLDWFKALVSNGHYLFQGNLTLTADVTDLTGSLLDPALVAPGGYVKLYRGTETQPVEPALIGHPAMRGTAYLIGCHVFFGQDNGTPPNWQVIAGGLPRVSTDIVAAIDNIADDGQVNPIACLAEFLLDERSMGFPQGQLVASTWLAAAHWCAQDQAHRDYTFCSPLIDGQTSFADISKALLEPFGGFLRWTTDGKLTCCIYEWGVDPGGLLTLDERHLTAVPKFVHGDWTQVKTEMLATFVDRDYEFQENTTLVPNARARQIRQLDDQGRLDRKHFTRLAQVHRQTTEYNRRAGLALGTGTLKVRQPFVAALNVGDKVKVNVNPEPGGTAIARLCRIEKIVQDRTDEAELTVMPDALLPAAAYTPAWIPPTPVEALCSPLVHVLGVPLPLAYTGWPPALAFLATRPSADIVGFQVLFAANPSDPFAELGTQGGFAVRAALAANITSGAATANFTETDGLTAPDAGLAANTPGGNAAEAQDDTLLALIATLDGYDRISLDGAGVPIMEFVSIVDRTFVSGATYTYNLLRGRLGTVARAWTTAATVWIVPRVNLPVWEHTQLPDLQGSTVYARLVAYNSVAVSDTSIPEADINLPPAPTPANLTLLSDESTSLRQADGTVLPRILVGWDLTTDAAVLQGGHALIEYKPTGSGTWLHWGAIEATKTSDYLTDVKAGTSIDVRLRYERLGQPGPYTATATITVGLETLTEDPSNLVQNGRFAAGDFAWPNKDHWVIESTAGEVGWGARNTLAAASALRNARRIACSPGDLFVIRGRVYGINTYLRVTFYDSTDTEISYYPISNYGSSGVWVSVALQVAAPENAVWCRGEAVSYNLDEKVDSISLYRVVQTDELGPPSLSPPGQKFTSTITVNASHALGGVTLRYTEDGTSVTGASPEFPGGGLTLTVSVLLRVKAFLGAAVSPEVMQSYTVDSTTEKVATPSVSATGTRGRTALIITLSCGTSGATIKYAIDGGSTVTYSAPFSLGLASIAEIWAEKSGLGTSSSYWLNNEMALQGGGIQP